MCYWHKPVMRGGPPDVRSSPERGYQIEQRTCRYVPARGHHPTRLRRAGERLQRSITGARDVGLLIAVADQVAVLIPDPMANGWRLTAVDPADAAVRGGVVAANGARLLNEFGWGEA